MKSTNKHFPQRTCVACRKVKPRRQLLRLVCNLEGNIQVDTGGKMVGRGAYLCRKRECWEVGLTGNLLGYALRSVVNTEDKERLARYGEELE